MSENPLVPCLALMMKAGFGAAGGLFAATAIQRACRRRPAGRPAGLGARATIATGCRASIEVPVADVRIDILAALHAVGAQREQIELASLAGIQVLVRLVPGV